MARGRMARALARKQDKQYSWFAGLDAVCSGIRLPPRYCTSNLEDPDVKPQLVNCETGVAETVQGGASPVALHLVEPRTASGAAADTSDEAYEADEVTIVRIVGYVALEPYFVADEDLLATIASLDPGPASNVVNNAILNTPYFLRAGLKKDGWIFDPSTEDYTPPRRNPLVTEEWVDGRFARTWQREKFAAQKAALGAHTEIQSGFLCSNVSAAAAGAPANTLSNGSGTINIPAISTACQFTDNTNGAIFTMGSSVQGQPEGIVKLNLNSRRRFRLRESEGLVLWLNWTSWSVQDFLDTGVDQDCIPAGISGRMAVGFDLRAHVKLLLETN